MNTARTNAQAQHSVSSYLAILLCSLCLFFIAPANAHEVRPAIVDLQLQGNGEYQLKIKLNLEVMLAGIGEEHEDTDDSEQATAYNALRGLAPQALEQRWQAAEDVFTTDLALQFDGVRQESELVGITIPAVGDTALARDSEILYKGQVPTGAGKLGWSWPERYGTHVLRISTPQQEDFHTAYLTVGQSSETLMLSGSNIVKPRSLWKIFSDYVVIGFQHIIPKGLDHILFVIGLFLLSASLSALLWQVTSTTSLLKWR